MSTKTVSPTDVIIRLAAALLLEGHRHPVAAAVAQAARMHALAAPEAFAERLAIDVFSLHRAEAGLVAFDRLPVAYLAFIDDIGGVDGVGAAIDLVGLRELAAAVDARRDSEPVGDGGVVLAFPGATETESVA